MSIVTTTIKTANKVATFIRPHIPMIAMFGGAACVCGGAFLACRATLKVDQVFEEHKAMLEHIDETLEKLPEGSLTRREIVSDKIQVYSMTAGKLFKLYGPAIGLGAAGFASMFYGFGLIKQWHALAINSVAAIDKSFAEYRKKVIDRYGVEVDEEFTCHRGQYVKAERTTTDENGNEKTESIDTIDFNDIVEDDFTRIFDYTNEKWENDYLMNDRFLNDLELWYTKHLRAHSMDHVFLNRVLKDLGFSETGIGHFYGWTDKPGCTVSFSVLPFVKIWQSDEDGQFPLLVPLPVEYDSRGIFRFINPDDEDVFRKAYIEDERNVGYILKFNVDSDENGIPRQIYNDVYGPKNVNAA